MRIQSELHIGNHPDKPDTPPEKAFQNGDPHAMGLIKVPFDSIKEHPRTKAIFEALPDDAKAFVKKEGNLALSHDFTYEEDYKSGVGLVVTGLSVDVARLKPAEKQNVADWMDKRYGVKVSGDRDTQQATLAMSQHITTDMTVAGMSKQYMMTLIREQSRKVPEDDRETALIPEENAAVLVQNIKTRLGLGKKPDLTPGSKDYQKLEQFHAGAKEIKDKWPSFPGEGFGGEKAKHGEVIFFKGGELLGASTVKAGPYAYACAWPGNAEFDDNGIARKENGKPVAANKVKVDKDYVYPPHAVISRSSEGQEAKAILDGFFDKGPCVYDGFDRNCAGVSGRAAMGRAFEQIQERGAKNEKLWEVDHLKALEAQGKLPAGTTVHQVDTQKADRSLDHNGLMASSKQVEAQLKQRSAQSVTKTEAVKVEAAKPAMKAPQASAKEPPAALAGMKAEQLAALKGAASTILRSESATRAPSSPASLPKMATQSRSQQQR